MPVYTAYIHNRQYIPVFSKANFIIAYTTNYVYSIGNQINNLHVKLSLHLL